MESLAAKWEEMHNTKGDLLQRCEQYARWTVPSIFPPENHSEEHATPQESEKGNVAIGARLINHLAHRVVDTMFPNDKPFFAIQLTPEAEKDIAEQADPELKGEIEAALMGAENAAMRNLNLTAYRPVAVQAVSMKIVTGNTLIYRLPDDKRVVYSIRDYCVRRSIAGDLLEVILRDIKLFRNLDPAIQEQVRQASPRGKYDDKAKCTLYTHYIWSENRWHQRQAVDEVELEKSRASFKEQDFPCLVLTWSLGRGDDYGRGLVEDYAVSFHNIDVLTAALIDMIGIAADVKFLVNDTSSFDVDAWNNASRGEYVPGKEGDITTPDFEFAVEIQVIAQAIEKAERELANAFLLSSAGVRDAERVTAEEIRFYAREIESAFGGLYSRLALDWQKREADYQLAQLDFQLIVQGKQTFETMVTTGMESLSREGKLDALRMSIADMQMLDAVPQEIRAAIHPLKFAAYIFGNRGVEAQAFLYTPEEFQANQRAEEEQQQRLMEKEGEVQAASRAAGQQ